MMTEAIAHLQDWQQAIVPIKTAIATRPGAIAHLQCCEQAIAGFPGAIALAEDLLQQLGWWDAIGYPSQQVSQRILTSRQSRRDSPNL